MKPDLLEKYVLEARQNKIPDDQIKQSLVIGGYNPVLIDAALQKANANQQNAQKKFEEILSVPQPVFFTAFLTIFVLVLIFYNVVLYWGQLSGDPSAIPVKNSELVGGIFASAIVGLILGGIYTGIVKLIRKIRARKK